jgi:hypothetical protein
MKQQKLFLLLLIICLSSSVHAIPFLNYPHNAFWNITAELPNTPTSDGWTMSLGGVNYTTIRAFNGSRSVNQTTTGGQYIAITPGTANNSLPANYNVTIYFYYPSTTALVGGTWGLRNITGNCGSDGSGVCIGSRSVTNNTNFTMLINNVWSTTRVPLSASWHVVEYHITNTYDYNVTLDGFTVTTGTGNNIGNAAYFNFLYDADTQIYFDDLHAWNSTNVSTFVSGVYASINDTRSNRLIGNFSFNYTTSNATDNNAKVGFCAATACQITNFSALSINITYYNISGDTASASYFNTTVNNNSIAFTTGTITVIGRTFTNYLNLSINNIVNGSNITGFTIKATNGTNTWNAYTSTGSIALYHVIGDMKWNYTNISAGTYFDVNGSAYASFNATVNITNTSAQALINVSAYRLYLNNSIANYNVTNYAYKNSTPSNNNNIVPANVGPNNVQVSVQGNYSMNYTITVSTALTILPYNATGIYDDLFIIGAKNISGSIPSFTTAVSNATLGGIIGTFTTTTGNTNIPVLQGYYYTFQITSTGYGLANVTIPANASTNLYNFSLIPANALFINVYDEATNNPITSNISIAISSIAYSTTGVTNTSSYNVTNLTAGTYTITLSGSGYTSRSYSATIVDNYAVVLNTYLTNSTNTVVFTVRDSSSQSTLLSNAYMSMSKVISGSPTVVESHLSDITGRAQFTYVAGTAYTFNISKSGYTTKSFTLDPVLFSSYDVLLDKSTTGTPNYDYSGIIITVDPQRFYNDVQNNITLTVYSPTGKLRSYNFTLAYPGGNGFYTGTNQYGEVFNVSANITGAGIFDTLNMTYAYTDSNNNNRSFSFNYIIIGGYTNSTIYANRDNTYGLGVLERGFIGTILIVFAAGFVTLLAGPLLGAMVGLFVMGSLMYIGFMPYLASALAIMIGFFIIARRSE